MPCGDETQAGRIDVDAVSLALVHHFGVTGDDVHPDFVGSPLDGLDDPPQVSMAGPPPG